MKPVPSTAVSARRLLRAPTAARLRARAALALLVAALVVGILGMHALATHGTHAPALAAAASSVTPAGETAGEMAGHRMAAGHPTGHSARLAAADTSTVGDERPGPGHDMGSMVMLCVVMLVAAAVGLLALLVSRRVGPLLPAAFQPAVAHAAAARRVRGTGPPHVWAFSVIRC